MKQKARALVLWLRSVKNPLFYGQVITKRSLVAISIRWVLHWLPLHLAAPNAHIPRQFSSHHVQLF